MYGFFIQTYVVVPEELYYVYILKHLNYLLFVHRNYALDKKNLYPLNTGNVKNSFL